MSIPEADVDEELLNALDNSEFSAETELIGFAGLEVGDLIHGAAERSWS